MASTMMPNEYLKIPEGTIITELWPMEMDHLVWILNGIPNIHNGISPI